MLSRSYLDMCSANDVHHEDSKKGAGPVSFCCYEPFFLLPENCCHANSRLYTNNLWGLCLAGDQSIATATQNDPLPQAKLTPLYEGKAPNTTTTNSSNVVLSSVAPLINFEMVSF